MATFTGGDEVGALVLDIGTWNTRAGHAGEDVPKHVLPSFVGHVPSSSSSAMDVDGAEKGSFYFGTNDLSVYRDHQTIGSPFNSLGLVEDWDLYDQLVTHCLRDRLAVEASEHPVLLSEPVHNTAASRAKLTELMFEGHNLPAFFLAKDAVLTSFASARSTSVVFDCGASTTRCSVVYDGYVLRKAQITVPFAGNAVAQYLRELVRPHLPQEVNPKYLFNRKSVGGKWAVTPIPRSHATPSFHDYQVRNIFEDMKLQVCKVHDTILTIPEADSVPFVSYELPDGSGMSFNKGAYAAIESIFNPGAFPGGDPSRPGACDMIKSVITQADQDIRRELYASVIATGGTTLTPGFVERLYKDLEVPSTYKAKMIAPTTPELRRFSSWIGGSILASLGSFHQMWISSEEYGEIGSEVVNKKCP